jgi:hypothetical protein
MRTKLERYMEKNKKNSEMNNKISFYVRMVALVIGCRILAGADHSWILLGATMMPIVAECQETRYTWVLPSTALIGVALIVLGVFKPLEYHGIVEHDARYMLMGVVQICFVLLLIHQRQRTKKR